VIVNARLGRHGGLRCVNPHSCRPAIRGWHSRDVVEPHCSLKDPYARTPAVAAGVSDHVWSLVEVAGLLD
jgi:hypothetical protein